MVTSTAVVRLRTAIAASITGYAHRQCDVEAHKTGDALYDR